MVHRSTLMGFCANQEIGHHVSRELGLIRVVYESIFQPKWTWAAGGRKAIKERQENTTMG